MGYWKTTCVLYLWAGNKITHYGNVSKNSTKNMFVFFGYIISATTQKIQKQIGIIQAAAHTHTGSNYFSQCSAVWYSQRKENALWNNQKSSLMVWTWLWRRWWWWYCFCCPWVFMYLVFQYTEKNQMFRAPIKQMHTKYLQFECKCISSILCSFVRLKLRTFCICVVMNVCIKTHAQKVFTLRDKNQWTACFKSRDREQEQISRSTKYV